MINRKTYTTAIREQTTKTQKIIFTPRTVKQLIKTRAKCLSSSFTTIGTLKLFSESY